MSYFNRPKLLRSAVESIVAANAFHSDWRLAFADDGSIIPGRPIVEEVLGDLAEKATFVETNMTFEDKIQKGLLLGKLANEAIRDSDADAGITLCDDDELCPEYLKDLSEFFESNLDVQYCYSNIYLWNPLLGQRKSEAVFDHRYNWNTEAIEPVGRVDASQVAWRLDCCKRRGAWFADSTLEVAGLPWIRDTDKAFFRSLYEQCGPCFPTGLFAQYKAIHDYQLLWHKQAGEEGLRDYDEKVRRLAGVLL